VAEVSGRQKWTRGEKAALAAMLVLIAASWTAVFMTDAWQWL
jgi:hypothetical protein